MSEKNLSIISTKDNMPSGGEVSINSLREYSSLSYLKDGSWRRVVEGKTSERPVHISEVIKKLKSRDWNIGGRSMIHTDGDLYYDFNTNYDSPIPTPSISKCMKVSTTNETEGEQIEEALLQLKEDSVYNKVFSEMDEREINLFTTIGSTIDILSGVKTIDIITYNSDSYTNILSLIPLKRYAIQEGVSAKINLGIQYTSRGIMKNYKTTFSAFNYRYQENDGGLVLESEDWIKVIGDDEIQVEFIEGILKALPLSNDVSECIISNCTVIYGKLGK